MSLASPQVHSRRYPHDFTFYLAGPMSSIGAELVIFDLWQQEAVRALQQGKDVVVQAPTALRSAVRQRCYFRLCVTEESIQIQGPCIHRDRTIGIVRPFLFRAIPVKLQPVLIGIAEVKRFTHPVITRAFERNLRREQTPERVAEPRSIGISAGDFNVYLMI